jgi:hypothetical protein
MDQQTAELYKLRFEVAAIKEWLATNLGALEDQINGLLPEDTTINAPPGKYDARAWLKERRKAKGG